MPGYSFYRQRGQALLQKWNQIPNKTDILVTHTPPLGMKWNGIGDERRTWKWLQFSLPNFNPNSLKGHGDFNSWTKVVILHISYSILVSFYLTIISFKLDGMLAGCAGQQPMIEETYW
jgi:hypothetical protein